MKRTLFTACLIALGGLVFYVLPEGAASAQAWKNQIGWTQLFNEVGPGLEDGTGIPVLLTEAAQSGNFMPNTASTQFTGKTIVNGTNTNNNASTHSTSMANTFFGNTLSVAPGVTDVTVYLATDWRDNKLGFATGADPVAHPFRVSNNSWISSGYTAAQVTDFAQRIDFVALQNQMTIVGGTNNGSTNALPQMLSHAYNTIMVGRTDGNHAVGQTTTYGNPRRRPDIVAPQTTTSASTATVSSVAAMLHQKAVGTDADRIDTMRAILLSGATRDLFPSWSRTSTQPLDTVYGAGQVNVYNSYRIMEAGPFAGTTSEPMTSAGVRGWDYRSSIQAGANNSMFYDFVVAEDTVWQDFTVALTWNMIITDTNPDPLVFAPTQLLGNLDLFFYDSTAGFLDTQIGLSVATGGNIEFLNFETLLPGRYTLRVVSDTSRDYAIAWNGRLVVIPEPSIAAVLVVMSVGLLVRRRRS